MIKLHYEHQCATGAAEVEITDEIIREGIDLALTYGEADYVDDVFDRVRVLLETEHKDGACCSVDEICDLLMRHWGNLLKKRVTCPECNGTGTCHGCEYEEEYDLLGGLPKHDRCLRCDGVKEVVAEDGYSG